MTSSKFVSITAAIVLPTTLFVNESFAGELFSSKESKGEISTAKTPVFIKTEDGTLLSVSEVEGRLKFHKNAAGYTQKGGGLSIAGFELGASVSDAGKYFEIGYLETLAYFDNDWRKILTAVEREFLISPRSVNPALIKTYLEPLVDPRVPDLEGVRNFVDIKLPVLPEIPPAPGQFDIPAAVFGGDEAGYFRARGQLDAHIFATQNLEKIKAERAALSQYRAVYLKVSNNDLIRISQIGKEIKFHKNAAGYANTKVSASIAGNGLTIETAEGNKYIEISPAEVVGYLDGDREKIIQAVTNQRLVFDEGSVDPALVRESLYKK